jgi:glycosyltransferase involved in cell wall biosynthesis
VNGHCRVLAGQVVRANGGLYYRSSAEFSETLQWLLTHPVERATLGAQGRAYIDAEYRWPTVIARVEALLGQVMARRGR